jgi:hypothetical protein
MGTAKQRLMKTLPVNESVRTNYRFYSAAAFLHLLAAVAGVQITLILSPVGPQLARCFIWTARSRAI